MSTELVFNLPVMKAMATGSRHTKSVDQIAAFKLLNEKPIRPRTRFEKDEDSRKGMLCVATSHRSNKSYQDGHATSRSISSGRGSSLQS